MKNSVPLLLLVFVLFSFMACSSTNRLTLGVTKPAKISLALDVVNIGIIDRSMASEKNKTLDKIDKILSLEGLNLDREGAQNAIRGLQQELERGNRFEAIKVIAGQKDFEKGLGVFPAPLSWDVVEQLCAKNNVDVIFSLEFYDTDTTADYEMAMLTIPNNLGIAAKVPGHAIKLNTMIKNGWRVYDPALRVIVDEYISNDHVISKGKGINPIKALEAIIGRKEAVLSLSTNLGISYGLYTNPERIRIARDYFVRGSTNFKIAKRRAQTGNWEGAAELWNAELNHPKAKVAGRAYYNMAISSEINGDLDQAIEFASRAYADYRNKLALRYVNILKGRVMDQRELERQLSE